MGIKAIKFNFSNIEQRHVILRLVKNRTAIEYEDIKQRDQDAA